MALASYFIILPGLWLLLRRIALARGWDPLCVFVASLPAAAALAVILRPWHPLAGFLAFTLLAALGWAGGWRALTAKVEHLLYLLAFPGTLLPLHFSDATVYQLRIPRDIHRFGLDAIDGTSFFHTLLGFPHVFLSAFAFDDRTLTTTAIGLQALCAVALLRWIRSLATARPWTMVIAWLAVPLNLLMMSEPLVDLLGALITAQLLVRLTSGPVTLPTLLVFGLSFGIKPTIPLLLSGPLLLAMYQRRVPMGHLGRLLGIMASVGLLQLMVNRTFLIPHSVILTLGREAYEIFSLEASGVDALFHQHRWQPWELLLDIFWRTSPLLILGVIGRKDPLFKPALLALVTWWLLFPQTRFFLYLFPVGLVILGRAHAPRLHGIMLGIALGLLALRGIPAWWQLRVIPAYETSAHPIHPTESAFLKHLPSNSIIYSEKDPGWELPGRVIFALNYSHVIPLGEDWPDSFKKLGVTHMILAEPRSTSSFPGITDPLLIQKHDQYERKRLACLEPLKSWAHPLAREGNHTLYRIDLP